LTGREREGESEGTSNDLPGLFLGLLLSFPLDLLLRGGDGGMAYLQQGGVQYMPEDYMGEFEDDDAEEPSLDGCDRIPLDSDTDEDNDMVSTI
jgi:hypothetical protein